MQVPEQEISQRDFRIFATGVFLVPIKITVGEIETWRWVVDSFEDDSFFEGEAINPKEHASEKDRLVDTFEWDNTG